ncbi:hypothetical protein [Streptomyces mutabilis]|jgi:hypothetical protein|uniref:hypothetical protein n=1 Tax=Streptomyces mutabilis TaxID=67332 RepID=UPI0036CC68A4
MSVTFSDHKENVFVPSKTAMAMATHVPTTTLRVLKGRRRNQLSADCPADDPNGMTIAPATIWLTLESAIPRLRRKIPTSWMAIPATVRKRMIPARRSAASSSGVRILTRMYRGIALPSFTGGN